MYPMNSFYPMPMAYPFNGQSSIYSSQYPGFNPPVGSVFPQALSSRAPSLPPPTGPYQYPVARQAYPAGTPPAPAPPSQPYPTRQRQRSKNKKSSHRQKEKRKTHSSDEPPAELGLYSDREHAETVEKSAETRSSPVPADESKTDATPPVQSSSNDRKTPDQDAEQNKAEQHKRKSHKKKHREHSVRSGHRKPSIHDQAGPTPYTAFPQAPGSNNPSTYPYGYPAQAPFANVRPPGPAPFNAYPPNMYPPSSVPYNVRPTWSTPAQQEIQRLRSHIHSLEGQLHKLQKKLNKTHLDQHDKSKENPIRSPRQTPVIVELNSNNHESSTKQVSNVQDQHNPSSIEQESKDSSYQRNFNQSNNNDLDESQTKRSVEKILDAFERFYINQNGSTTPMKVKFIPEERPQMRRVSASPSSNWSMKKQSIH